MFRYISFNLCHLHKREGVNVKRELVLERLQKAYDYLLKQDIALFEVDANERSLTHKFAEYLQSEFSEWNVDCEYNRNGNVPKRLTFGNDLVSTGDTDGSTVYPDIIVHHRKTAENLVVIEAKKSSTASVGNDREKLKAYKLEHNYNFAFAVEFPVGNQAHRASSRVDIVEVQN